MNDDATPLEDPAGPKPEASLGDYLRFGLSIPERALRSTTGIVGGAVRESAERLVPAAFQDSTTYGVLVRNTLDFLVEDVAGVQGDPKPDDAGAVEGYVARKAVGNFVEMAGIATLHVSPLMMLAIVSDIAYGSQTYLKELTLELKRDGIIDEDSTINRAADLLNAVQDTTGSAASMIDTPPLSVEGLRQSIQQTRDAAGRLDPTDVLPLGEIDRLWSEMRDVAQTEDVSLMEVSSAVTLRSLDRVADVGRGALSSVRVAGSLLDRHILDHYRQSITDIHEQGYYQTLAQVSEPYIEAVWTNFSTTRPTITEDVLSGKLIGNATRGIGRWLGWSKNQPDENSDSPPR